MSIPTSETDFPDVDAVFDDAAGPPPVLDYRHAKPVVRIPDPSVAAREAEAWRNVWRFIRRLVFAGALASLCGGLGLSIEPRGDGALLMAVEAGVLGLFLRMPGAGGGK
jgi:hypothetical protein